MKITKFKKYVTWNIISLIGYVSIALTIAFLVMLGLSSSQLNMRIDLNKYVYEYIFKHLILPYLSVYKFQLSAIIVLLIASIGEKKYYEDNEIYGFRIFENNEKIYSTFFIIGLILNFCPLYMFSMYILKILMKIF